MSVAALLRKRCCCNAEEPCDCTCPSTTTGCMPDYFDVTATIPASSCSGAGFSGPATAKTFTLRCFQTSCSGQASREVIYNATQSSLLYSDWVDCDTGTSSTAYRFSIEVFVEWVVTAGFYELVITATPASPFDNNLFRQRYRWAPGDPYNGCTFTGTTTVTYPGGDAGQEFTFTPGYT